LGYFTAAYGITSLAPEGVSTETEPSARDIASIIVQIKKEKIPAVFLESISDPRLMRQIASETGTKIGGTLCSDSLTEKATSRWSGTMSGRLRAPLRIARSFGGVMQR
jgi:zinc/manganese transport system substrate-binding protein